ncbi:hypothetical protein N657DRAFT_691365 [Parathielavia appendiculata]|uniref:Uncharacterized protein n=1 Tax=Parathielavia appendiculata TaxID=2587402 RepID=A0AAN6TY73_9PEZI|nr:hypothetical protein N657DRAFT_691365 [Parathielavia appendiculata]
MDSICKPDDVPAERYLRGKEYVATRRASGYFDEHYAPKTASRRNPPPPSLDLSRRSKSTSHLTTASCPPAARRTATSTTSTTATTPTTAARHRNRSSRQSSRRSSSLQSSRRSSSLFDPENLAFYTHLGTKISTAAREANGSTASLRSALGATLSSGTAATDLPPTRAAPYSQRPREDPYERKAYLPPLSSATTSPTSPSSLSSVGSPPVSRRHSRDNGAVGSESRSGYVPGPVCKPGSVTPRQRAAFARIDGTVEGLQFYFGKGSGASQWEVDQFFYGTGEEEEEVNGGECDGDGPDFVNLNERLEGLQEEDEDEERVVVDKEYLRKMVKEQGRFWPWVASLMVGEARSDLAEDDDEDEEEDEYGGEVDPYELERRLEEERRKRRAASELRLQECTITPLDATNDPPPDENGGLWRDVSWLLSVAGNALFR